MTVIRIEIDTDLAGSVDAAALRALADAIVPTETTEPASPSRFGLVVGVYRFDGLRYGVLDRDRQRIAGFGDHRTAASGAAQELEAGEKSIFDLIWTPVSEFGAYEGLPA